jgi:hypothetical protein
MHTSLNNSCVICDQGTFSVGNVTTCQRCPQGLYSAYYGSTSCGFCPPGTYGNNSTAPKCLSCPVGFWNNDYGQSTCSICGPRTTTAKEGSISPQDCSLCQGGYFTLITNNQTNCLECPLGTFSFTNSSNCSSCSAGSYSNRPQSFCSICPPGRYSPITGSPSDENCFLCPAGRYANGSQALKECPLCPQGTFNPEEGLNSSSCRLCPLLPNVLCPSGSSVPYVGPGMYRSLDKPGDIFECIPPAACQKTEFNATKCSDAYTGTKCSQCASNHFRSGGNCVICMSPIARWALLGLCCVIVVFALSKLSENQQNIPNSLKLTLFWFQFLAMYPSLSSSWPPILMGMLNFVSVLNFDIGYFGVGCDIAQNSYYILLIMKLIFPLLLIIILTLNKILLKLLGRNRKFSFGKILSNALYLTVFFSIQLFSSMFQVFNCVESGNGKVVSQDPSVRCYTDSWKRIAAFSGFMIFFYLIIIPTSIAFAWYKAKALGQLSKLENQLLPITQPYHKGAKWYEGARLGFKLVFVLIRDAFGLSRLSKIVFIGLVLIIVAWFESRQRPYNEPVSNDITTM